jgi:serine/threonine protein kinase
VHPNIVTLHHVLETSAFLLLLFEFVPGENLSDFLKHARDSDDVNPILYPGLPYTPPTSDIPSSLPLSQLFSDTRLRLVASMFSQMCEAVATCHDASVFLHGIRPENFIVKDSWAWNEDGILERRVIVKLCDFSQYNHNTDLFHADVPYMSYGMLLLSFLRTLS